MNMALFFPAFSGLLWACIGVIYSLAARRQWDFLNLMTVNSILTFSAAALIFPRWHAIGTQAGLVPLVWILILAGVFQAVGMLLMQKAMQTGHHAVAWTLSQAAMVIPFFSGFIIWHDALSLLKWAGLAMILSAVIFFATANRKKSGGTPLPSHQGRFFLGLALAAFAAIGIQQTLVGVPSRWAGWTDTAALRIPLLSLGSLVTFLILCAARKRFEAGPMLKMAVLMLILGLPGHYFIFNGLDAWARIGMAGAVYPIAIGVCVTAFAGYSIFFIREKTTLSHYIGILAGIAGIAAMAF